MGGAFKARVDAAVADLERIGRHWLPDQGAKEVHAAVEAQLSTRTILHLEPDPWDEHVLADADKGYLPDEIRRIARRRVDLREQGIKTGLPE